MEQVLDIHTYTQNTNDSGLTRSKVIETLQSNIAHPLWAPMILSTSSSSMLHTYVLFRHRPHSKALLVFPHVRLVGGMAVLIEKARPHPFVLRIVVGRSSRPHSQCKVDWKHMPGVGERMD